MLFGMFNHSKIEMVPEAKALPGRGTAIMVPGTHFIFGRPMDLAGDHLETAVFGMGCYWGAERKFWKAEGVVATAVGYAAGFTPNPTYEEVCSGQTGHNEVVRVAWDPNKTSFAAMLKVFWDNHNPTQGMGQGNDAGTQYRSGIYFKTPAQEEAALASRDGFQGLLSGAGHGQITTEIVPAGPFYFAETYHQEYLAKNPGGYCGLGGTGVSCGIGPAP
jgi:peptide-methionine (S)-S-oxide reductase